MNWTRFPSRYYQGVLKEDPVLVRSRLEKVTLLDNQYVIDWNANTFNGFIQDHSFEVTLSNKHYGKLCVFKGILENKKIYIKVHVKTSYKWILTVLFLYPIIGLTVSFYLGGFDVSKELIFHSLMVPITFRVALEIGFIYLSKKGIKHLTKVLEIKTLKKNRK